MEPYNKQVSDKESTSFFGTPGFREVNGPIAALFCKAGKDCPKLKLQSFSPNLPWIEDDQTVANSGNGRWKKSFNFGLSTCNRNEIVTGVKCQGQNCASVRLKCSPLNSKLYQRDSFSKPASEWTSQFKRRTRCGKNSYMVGMECKGRNGCSQIRLYCSKIEYKDKKLVGGGCGNVDLTPPPITCKDKTLNNGLPWSDSDGKRCYDYSTWDWCSTYGDDYRNTYTANEACCECDGGDRS